MQAIFDFKGVNADSFYFKGVMQAIFDLKGVNAGHF
jgi:hypothetical protein